jgi:uncharacterized protein YdeI (YjbR/CyaY-like superfamily)
MSAAATGKDGLAIMAFIDADAMAAWLERHHARPDGIWLKIAKKASGIASVTYSDAVDVALCYGWIDGTKLSHDDAAYLQKFTPRRARSIWSRINIERVARLVAAGRMHAAGTREVERAKVDGRWAQAYDSHRTATVPPDLQQQLDKSKKAAAFFATLNSANRYAILWRIQTAKKPETRAKRIMLVMDMLKKKETFH